MQRRPTHVTLPIHRVGAIREAMLFPFDNFSISSRHGLQLELIAAQRDGGNPVVPLGGPRAPDAN